MNQQDDIQQLFTTWKQYYGFGIQAKQYKQYQDHIFDIRSIIPFSGDVNDFDSNKWLEYIDNKDTLASDDDDDDEAIGLDMEQQQQQQQQQVVVEEKEEQEEVKEEGEEENDDDNKAKQLNSTLHHLEEIISSPIANATHKFTNFIRAKVSKKKDLKKMVLI